MFITNDTGCHAQEAVEYCTKQHGYLVEYQLYDEFDMVRSTIKDIFGSYWFWVGASNNENNETYCFKIY